MSPIQFALYDGEGLLLARSEDFSEHSEAVQRIQADAELGEDEREVVGKNGETIYIFTQRFSVTTGETFFLQYGTNYSGIQTTLDAFRQTALFAVPIILVVALGGGILLTGRMLRPISKLTDSVKGISITDLKKGLPASGSGDELDELTQAFNDLFNRLHESYQRIVQFTADVSHELRLPVTTIKGEAEIVLGRERTLEEYQKVLGSIIEEFNRLTVMINRLLALTRADSGKDELELQPVNLSDLVSKLIEFYEPLSFEKNIHLTLKNGHPVQVQADPYKLQELFSNLLENAVKYTARGSVTFTLKESGDKVQVEVKDTGIGIPLEEQDKIFERFYRVDKSRSREEGGVGLGLSIAQSIAEAHQGSVTVTSEPGKGSCFTVTLPK